VTTDAPGNVTSDAASRTFVCNQAGRLYQMFQGTTLLATYSYDYQGRRTRKVTTAAAPQGAQTVVYHYDWQGHLIAETSATGAPIRTYVWREDVPVAQVDYSPTRHILYLDVDHLNTPREARDATGKVVWRWESDAFGSTLPNEDPDGDGNKTTVNLRFPGQYYDQESGLNYNRNRTYDPAVGRDVESDPLALIGGIDTYAYVAANPLAFIDPLGLTLVPVNLPGLGRPTYLDDAFLPAVQQFIANEAANGVALHVNSACRNPTYQAQLRNDPNAITPADHSFHSCGYAVDVNFRVLPRSQQQIILNAATAAGLSWRGNFSTPDPPHFYMNPLGDRNTAIQNATQEYLHLTGQQP
jgi:RHS repeat-associated protein